MNSWISIIGFFAAILSTVALIPQIIKLWRTKSVDDVSTGMFIIFSIAVTAWLTYGFLIRDTPVIVANLIQLLFALIILFLKMRYRSNRS